MSSSLLRFVSFVRGGFDLQYDVYERNLVLQHDIYKYYLTGGADADAPVDSSSCFAPLISITIAPSPC